jgi:hypothetical protein
MRKNESGEHEFPSLNTYSFRDFWFISMLLFPMDGFS